MAYSSEEEQEEEDSEEENTFDENPKVTKELNSNQ